MGDCKWNQVELARDPVARHARPVAMDAVELELEPGASRGRSRTVLVAPGSSATRRVPNVTGSSDAGLDSHSTSYQY